MDNQQALRLTKFLDTVGECVRRDRGHRQLSLRKLSELTGLSHRAIWKVEHGKTDPRLSTLFMLSEALECMVTDFLDVQPDPQAEDSAPPMLRLRLSKGLREGLDPEIADALVGWLKMTLTSEDALESVMDRLRGAVIARLINDGIEATGGLVTR